MSLQTRQVVNDQPRVLVYEIIDAETLARRWNIGARFVREHSRKNKVRDPIPSIRFGRFIRYEWLSPELEQWKDRRKQRV